MRALDAKGRSPIPKHFREAIQRFGFHDPDELGDLVLVPYPSRPDPRIRVYLTQGFEALMDRREEISRELRTQDPATRQGAEDALAVLEWMIAMAELSPVDGLWRITIPRRLRDRLGLGKQVLWLGKGDFMELYEPEAFERSHALDPGVAESGLGFLQRWNVL